MLSKVDRDALKKQIAIRMAEGEAIVQSLKATLAPRESDCGIGRMSANDSLPDRGATEAVLKLQREELEKLSAAYARLEDPDFGACQRCGQAIPVDRLMAVPESRVCTACKRV